MTHLITQRLKINSQFFLMSATLLVVFFQGVSSLVFAESLLIVKVKQGETAFLKIPSSGNQPVFEGRFLGKTIYFNRLKESDQFGALLGVDLDEKASQQPLTDVSHKETLAMIQILPNQFALQEVKVAPQYVNPSPKQLKKINREKTEMLAILSVVSDKKLWNSNFIIPVKGIREGRFGSRRVFNGEARNPHNGEDIAAAEKTPVYASNDGVIVGVVNHFFSGKGIIIDHGQGLFTEYFHLYKSEVKKGQKVRKGTEIGLVGHTGRATGPHLHWGMLINGARVNPFSVLQLDLE
jgi:murein DD-endopeptidase MepM/ murein hydrolase activator NlpD